MREVVTSFADAVAAEGEEPYFCFCATLRIFGDIGDLEAIGHQLGLQPTCMYRKGERKSPRRPDVWPRDGWLYQPPVDENRPLEEHIMALWDRLRPHMAFLKVSLIIRWTSFVATAPTAVRRGSRSVTSVWASSLSWRSRSACRSSSREAGPSQPLHVTGHLRSTRIRLG